MQPEWRGQESSADSGSQKASGHRRSLVAMSWLRSPAVMRRLNGWLAIAAVILIPVSLITGWIDSVRFVAALSIWALVSGHWSGWQSARVETKQDENSS